MGRKLARLVADEGGQDLIEYALLAALLATLSITAISLLGNAVEKLFTDLAQYFPPA